VSMRAAPRQREAAHPIALIMGVASAVSTDARTCGALLRGCWGWGDAVTRWAELRLRLRTHRRRAGLCGKVRCLSHSLLALSSDRQGGVKRYHARDGEADGGRRRGDRWEATAPLCKVRCRCLGLAAASSTTDMSGYTSKKSDVGIVTHAYSELGDKA